MKCKNWIPISLLVFGGCIARGSEETATERFHFNVRGSPRIVARIDDGSLEIVGIRAQEVRVNVLKKARAPNPEAAAALLDELEVDASQQDDTVSVEVRRGSGWGWDHGGISFGMMSLSSEVEMRVPRETDLELVTNDGRITIEGVEGRIEAETHDGRVRLRAIKGTLRARTSDGSIVGIDLDGDIDVSSGNGRLELEGRFQGLKAVTSDGSIKVRCDENTPPPAEDWYIRSSNGSITVTLPKTWSANVEASTSDGRVINDLRFTESEEGKHWVQGKLGQGGNLILVRTSDGRITLRSR